MKNACIWLNGRLEAVIAAEGYFFYKWYLNILIMLLTVQIKIINTISLFHEFLILKFGGIDRFTLYASIFIVIYHQSLVCHEKIPYDVIKERKEKRRGEKTSIPTEMGECFNFNGNLRFIIYQSYVRNTGISGIHCKIM